MIGVQNDVFQNHAKFGGGGLKKFNGRDGRVGEKQSREGRFQKLRYYMYYIYSE